MIGRYLYVFKIKIFDFCPKLELADFYRPIIEGKKLFISV